MGLLWPLSFGDLRVAVSQCPSLVPLMIKLVPESPRVFPSIASSFLLPSITNLIRSFLNHYEETQKTGNHCGSSYQSDRFVPLSHCLSPFCFFIITGVFQTPTTYSSNMLDWFLGHREILQRKHPVLGASFLSLVPALFISSNPGLEMPNSIQFSRSWLGTRPGPGVQRKHRQLLPVGHVQCKERSSWQGSEHCPRVRATLAKPALAVAGVVQAGSKMAPQCTILFLGVRSGFNDSLLKTRTQQK